MFIKQLLKTVSCAKKKKISEQRIVGGLMDSEIGIRKLLLDKIKSEYLLKQIFIFILLSSCSLRVRN